MSAFDPFLPFAAWRFPSRVLKRTLEVVEREPARNVLPTAAIQLSKRLRRCGCNHPGMLPSDLARPKYELQESNAHQLMSLGSFLIEKPDFIECSGAGNGDFVVGASLQVFH